MTRWLKQSTSVDIPIGPFLDQTDGFTAETALTITQPDIRLKKNGGAWAQKNAAQTLTHEENGWYEVTLDATDTNTLGLLTVAVHESGALPVWEHFMVVPAQVWDSYLGADLLQVDTREVGGTAQTAGDIIGDTNDIQARLPAALVSGRIDASVGAMAAGTVTAAAIATNAFDADAVAADAVTEIQAGLATAAALALVQADTDDIQARLPATLSAGRMRSQVEGMDANTLNASALAADAATEIAAAVSASSAAAIATAVRQSVIEGAYTLEEVLRVIFAATSGLSNRPAAGQRAYRNSGNTKNRILAEVNVAGDRTNVTLDTSA